MPDPHFPPPRIEDVPQDGRLKVTKPNAETGEVVVEGAVPPSRFRRETAVEVIPAEAKRRILAGERPGLVWPGDEAPPVVPGQVVDLSTKIRITITRLTKTKGGDHRAYYSVRDFRPTIPRRVPKMFEMPEVDHAGYPIAPSKDAIDAATFDGNYCEDRSQGVPDIGEEVEIKYRRGLGVSARARAARRKRMEDPAKEAAKDIGPLVAEMREIGKRAAKMGVDPAPILAPIVREIEAAHEALSDLRKAA